MKTEYCINHPERHRNGTCIYCGNSICDMCISQHAGPFCCPACKEAMSFTSPASSRGGRAGRKKKKRYLCLWDIIVFTLFKLLPVAAIIAVAVAFALNRFCPEGREKWNIGLPQGALNQITLLDGLIVTNDELSTLTAWNSRNGQKAWTLVAPTQGRINSVRRIDQTSFLYGTDTTVCRVDIIPGNFHRHQWETVLPGNGLFEIMAADRDNTIIARYETDSGRPESEIFCLDTTDGRIRWKITEPHQIKQCMPAPNYVLLVEELPPDGNKLVCINRITGKTEWEQPVHSQNVDCFISPGSIVAATRDRIVDMQSNGGVNAVFKTTAAIEKIGASSDFIVFQDINGVIDFIDRREKRELRRQYFGPLTSGLFIQDNRLYFTVSRITNDILGRASENKAQTVSGTRLKLKNASGLVPMLVCVDIVSGNILWVCENASGKIALDISGDVILTGNYADFGPLATRPTAAAFMLVIDPDTGEAVQHQDFESATVIDCMLDSGTIYAMLSQPSATNPDGDDSPEPRLAAVQRKLIAWKPAVQCASALMEKARALIN